MMKSTNKEALSQGFCPFSRRQHIECRFCRVFASTNLTKYRLLFLSTHRASRSVALTFETEPLYPFQLAFMTHALPSSTTACQFHAPVSFHIACLKHQLPTPTDATMRLFLQGQMVITHVGRDWFARSSLICKSSALPIPVLTALGPLADKSMAYAYLGNGPGAHL